MIRKEGNGTLLLEEQKLDRFCRDVLEKDNEHT
jgi:hypothetical protein